MLIEHARKCFLAALCLIAAQAHAQDVGPWPQHSMDRPKPKIIDAGPPPSDAIVLFNGHDLSNWRNADSADKPALWKVENGYIEVVPHTGNIATKQVFGDCQLHIEWATPAKVEGEGQERGNSGVFMAGKYEIQVLDSYNNVTYADGQAASIFGQYPPLVNASRPPGEWQTYDVIWHGPRFDANGKLTRKAHVTVFHNGVLVQDDVTLTGPTAHMKRPPYTPDPVKMPLALQDHTFPVRYRNIWVRELPN